MFFISFALIQKPLEDGNIESKAEFIISVEWDDYHPDDVDLIVEDPKGNVVYFQNKEDGLMHLDRDDRGNLADNISLKGEVVSSPINQETVTVRGLQVVLVSIVIFSMYCTAKWLDAEKIIKIEYS